MTTARQTDGDEALVEAMAVAIWGDDTWEHLEAVGKSTMRRKARAALAVVREREASEIAELRSTVVAFAGPWADRYADDAPYVPETALATAIAERDAARAEAERLREALEETTRYWRNEHARLCNSLVGIKRAADARRAEKDGERHQYYYHTADAALNGNSGYRARAALDQEAGQ